MSTAIQEVRNLTPHQVRILLGGGAFTFDPSGCARLDTETINNGSIWGIPTADIQLGVVGGLPPQQEGIVYIVSQIVAHAIDRDDLYYPIDIARDKQGRVIGANKLARIIRRR